MSEPERLSVNRPVRRKTNPVFFFRVSNGVGGFRQTAIREAATSDANFLGQSRHIPEKRSATLCAKVPFLIVILQGVVKGVDVGLTCRCNNGCPVKVSGDAKRASCSAFAVRAMAHAVHGWASVHCDGSLPAGTGSGHE